MFAAAILLVRRSVVGQTLVNKQTGWCMDATYREALIELVALMYCSGYSAHKPDHAAHFAHNL
jgi:hypothetical protein